MSRPFQIVRIAGVCGILHILSASAFATDRPNVVLIISDDQTYSDFGFMGHPHVRTPHIDRLAAKSARYPNGYVPSSVCRPSLVTLLTGLYPHQHGVHFNHPPPGFAKLTQSPEIGKKRYDALRHRATSLIRSVPTLPRILAAQGYRCFQTGKYWEGHWRNAGFTEGMTTAEPSKEPDALGNKRLATATWSRMATGIMVWSSAAKPCSPSLTSSVTAKRKTPRSSCGTPRSCRISPQCPGAVSRALRTRPRGSPACDSLLRGVFLVRRNGGATCRAHRENRSRRRDDSSSSSSITVLYPIRKNRWQTATSTTPKPASGPRSTMG